jgi:hypothetical protein
LPHGVKCRILRCVDGFGAMGAVLQMFGGSMRMTGRA